MSWDAITAAAVVTGRSHRWLDAVSDGVRGHMAQTARQHVRMQSFIDASAAITAGREIFGQPSKFAYPSLTVRPLAPCITHDTPFHGGKACISSLQM